MLLPVLLLVCFGSAAAQSGGERPDSLQPADEAATRTERLVALRARKRRQLEAPERGRVEKTIAWMEGLREEVRSGDGPAVLKMSPVLGGMQGDAGATIGVKADVTRDNPNSVLSLAARVSRKRYWGLALTGGYAPGPVVGYGYAQYAHMPREEFFGIGMDASVALQSDYGIDQFVGGGLLGVRPLPGLLTGGHVSYVASRLGPGRDDQLPDVEERFGPDEVPSLGREIDYLVVGGYAEVDRRSRREEHPFARRYAPTDRRLRAISMDARSGYFLAAQVGRFYDRTTGLYNFTRTELEAQQFVPIRGGYQVIALRQLVSLSDGREIPFYLMQGVGGKRTVRGFTKGRFRDVHALVLNAEYRYEIWRLLDAALFVDAGQVFGRMEEIAPAHMAIGYGAGLRLKTSDGVFARLDVAHSREGLEVYASLSSFW